MDQLKSMAAFVQIVELGGLSGAAERQGISATMAGNHLRALEGQLGARLLNRTTRRQSLTEVGRTYYEQCRQILQLVVEANAGVSIAQAAPRGLLRVAAPVSFGAERLTPALKNFLAKHVEVSVDLALSDRMVDLVEEGFDAAIRIGDLADSALVSRSLSRYRMWACAAPGYLAGRGTPTRPEELTSHECLVFSYAGGRWRLGEDAKAPKVAVQGRFRTDSGQALRVAAREGLGIIVQPEVLLAEDVASGRLVRLFEDHILPSRPMSVVFMRDRRMLPKLRAFIDFVVERFGETGAGR